MNNIRDMILLYTNLFNIIPYRRYLGQTPLAIMSLPIYRYQYTTQEEDNTIFALDGNPYLYKWNLPVYLESSVRIVGIDSIYNLKTNKQYFPVKVNNTSVIFSIQPEYSLDLSKDPNYRDSLVDELIITYQYVDQKLQCNLVAEKQTYGQYNLRIDAINNSDLSGYITFNESQILDFSDITEYNRTVLYIISIYNQTLFIYKLYVGYQNQMDSDYLESLIDIQRIGQDSTDPNLIKLHTEQLPDTQTIDILGSEFDIPDPKISVNFELQQLSESLLSGLSNDILFLFTQQMQQISEDEIGNSEIYIGQISRGE